MSRLRIALVSLGYRDINVPSATPPIGLLSIAAWVREKLPVELMVHDQRVGCDSVADVARKLLAFNPDVVGIRTLTPYAFQLNELTRALRAERPDCLIVLGGPHPTAFGAKAMEDNGVDLAVAGEGEIAFELILRARLDASGYDAIPGIYRRTSDGEIVRNPGETPVVQDLDTLPFLAYDLMDLAPYASVRRMGQVRVTNYLTFFSSRGCPYRCAYCHQVFGKRFRMQSAERMAAEIEHWTRHFGVREIEFVDDVFNLKPERVIRFSELAAQRNLSLGIDFPNGIRGDILTQEVVDALADAGTYHAAFALESGSPRIQKDMGKNLNIPKFLAGVEMAVKRRIFAHGFVMMGFPTETEEDLKATLEVSCNSKLHTASFFTVIPFPGTEIHDRVMKTCPERLKGLEFDGRDYTGIRVNCSAVPDETLFAYQRKAWRAFYLNPHRAFRIVRDYHSPWDLPRYIPEYVLRMFKGIVGE